MESGGEGKATEHGRAGISSKETLEMFNSESRCASTSSAHAETKRCRHQDFTS